MILASPFKKNFTILSATGTSLPFSSTIEMLTTVASLPSAVKIFFSVVAITLYGVEVVSTLVLIFLPFL